MKDIVVIPAKLEIGFSLSHINDVEELNHAYPQLLDGALKHVEAQIEAIFQQREDEIVQFDNYLRTGK